MKYLNFQIIGEKIKKRRIHLNITQEELAEYLDVNPSHISNIERGRANPSLTALVNIANFLNCSVDIFLENEYSYPEQSSDLDDTILKLLRNSDEELKKKIIEIIKIIK